MSGRKFVANLMAAAVLGSVLSMSSAAVLAAEDIRTAGGVPYVSGGVGDASLDRMTAMAKDFNLKLVFALSSGAFLSGVKVTIADAKGNTVLDVRSEGPWLLATLPQGTYRIDAVSSGKSISQNATVGKDKSTTVDFRWAAE